jgi:ADP-ribose pyrophosphatase
MEKVIRRETLYTGRYLGLEELTIALPDGRHGKREIVRVRDAVAVLPLDSEETVYLVRQNRPAIGEILLEIPAGLIDAEEKPEEAARRECEEEIGFQPQELIPLVRYAHAEGYSTGFITLFVGLELKASGPLRLDETEYLENVRVPFTELTAMVRSNAIKDSKTILSTLLWSEMRKTRGELP